MRFEKFKISHFKGIEKAELPLNPRGAGVFTLIGLNESGKTTILEALNSFDFTEDKHTALYSEKNLRGDRTSFIPKHRKSNFTGTVSIEGHIRLTDEERIFLASLVEKRCDCTVDHDSIPPYLVLTRGFQFKNSDYVGLKGGIPVELMIKRRKGRKFVQTKRGEVEWDTFATAFLEKVPDIVYFPTFLFTQPERIYLFEPDDFAHENDLNRLYRQVFESQAGSLPQPLVLQDHIVARALSDDKSSDKREQIDATLNDLSSKLSEIVFEGWAKVFGGEVVGREVVIRFGIEEIEKREVVFLEIFLREGGQTFRLSERSTGFRWFFHLFSLQCIERPL